MVNNEKTNSISQYHYLLSELSMSIDVDTKAAMSKLTHTGANTGANTGTDAAMVLASDTVYTVSLSADSSHSNDNISYITIFNAIRFDNAHIFYVIVTVSNTRGLILLCHKLFVILKPILNIEYCGKNIIKSCERKTNRFFEIAALSSVEVEKQKTKQHHYVSTINDQISNIGNMNMVTPTDRETGNLQSHVSHTAWIRAGSGGSIADAVGHHSCNNTLTAVTGVGGVATIYSKNNPSMIRFDATNLVHKFRNDTNTSLSINVQHSGSKGMMNSSYDNNDNSDNKIVLAILTIILIIIKTVVGKVIMRTKKREVILWTVEILHIVLVLHKNKCSSNF